MRLLASIATTIIVFTSVNCQATQQWTNCVNVIGISNYMVYNQFILALSPGIPGCTSTVNGVSGAITFQAGTNSVTSESMNALLASSLTAYTSGKSMQIYYDNAAGCFGQLIANGGYAGGCP